MSGTDDRATGTGADGSATAKQSLQDLVRAGAGGLLIGLPLFFTQEMWQTGFLLPSWKLILLLLIAFVVVIGYSTASGFRRERSRLQLLVDSVETLGMAVVVSAVALLILERIGPGVGLREALGKVALETVPVAFGVSLAGTQLAAPQDTGTDRGSDPGDGQAVGVTGRLMVAAGGSLLFALNVAPTAEPVILAIEATPWLLLLVVLGSYLVSLGIVFYSDFRGGRTMDAGGGPLDGPFGETAVAYGISLAVSLLLLWFFGRTDGASANVILAETVMLGLVASVGAAAGRLLVGGSRG